MLCGRQCTAATGRCEHASEQGWPWAAGVPKVGGNLKSDVLQGSLSLSGTAEPVHMVRIEQAAPDNICIDFRGVTTALL